MRALSRLGWQISRRRGSHLILVHRVTDETMVLAYHGTIRRSFAKSILKQHGISEEEFLDVF